MGILDIISVALFLLFLLTAIVLWMPSVEGNTSYISPPPATNLDAIKAEYMRRDPFDSVATIDFLFAVDACENPFEVKKQEPPRGMPPKPKPELKRYGIDNHGRPLTCSICQTAGIIDRSSCPGCIALTNKQIVDDLSASYRVNGLYMGCTPYELKHLQKMVQAGHMSPESARDILEHRLTFVSPPKYPPEATKCVETAGYATYGFAD